MIHSECHASYDSTYQNRDIWNENQRLKDQLSKQQELIAKLIAWETLSMSQSMSFENDSLKRISEIVQFEIQKAMKDSKRRMNSDLEF